MPRTRRHPLLFAAPLALALLAAVALAALTSSSTDASGDARSATARAAAVPSDQVFPVGGPDFQRAIAIAQSYWNAVPCQGQVSYSWQGLEPLTNARASWSNPTSAWGNPAQNFACEVVFNTGMAFDFPMLCTVMTHELGHLLGHQHDPNAGQLMSAIYTAPIEPCGGGQAQAAAVEPPADPEPAGEEIAWNVSDEPKAKTSKRTTKKRAKKGKSARRKRCYVRYRAGKRVRRCVPLKKRSGSARTASRRKTRA